MKKSVFSLICVLVFFSFSPLFAGGNKDVKNESAVPVSEPLQPLKIGVLPDLDSLPILAAGKEGLFIEQGLSVELVSFRNPVERDAAFQAGQLDGIVADTLGAVFSVLGGGEGIITSVTTGRYGLAASPSSGITSVRELAGKEIGISSNTVIEYVAATLLSDAGLPSADFKGLAVPQIPVRMELLLSDKLASACLPEPLYAMAVSRGAIPLGDSTTLSAADGMPNAPGVMLFTRASVKDKTRSLILFYKAYQKSCEKINANSDSYRDFLVESLGFPGNIKDTFQFVTYEMPRLPRQNEIDLVTKWMSAKGLIKRIPAYQELCAENLMASFNK